jgi:Na+/proline symporter
VGAFALGLFTRSANTTGTMIGMLTGLLVSLSVGLLSPQIFGVPGVAWTWNVFVGAVVTFGVGVAVSGVTRDESRAAAAGTAQ